MITKKYTIFLVYIALVVLALPSLYSGFKPSMEMSRIAFYMAIGIVFLTWPLWKQFKPFNVLSKGHAFLVVFVLHPALALMTGYIASNGTIGLILNEIFGEKEIKTVEVLDKIQCQRWQRGCGCGPYLRVTTDPILSNGKLCVDIAIWNGSEIGQKIQVLGYASRYGFNINEVKNSR